MQREDSLSEGYGNFLKPLLAMASLFEDSFSVDWLVELTEQKVSEILIALEEGIQQKWLNKVGPATYAFCDSRKREECLSYLAPQDKAHLHKSIAELLIRELPENDLKVKLLAPHLLFTPNRLTNCHWLVRAGDYCRKTFRNEEALKYYSKALDHLSVRESMEGDRFFVQVAIKYSKISTARLETTTVLEVLKQALERANKWKMVDLPPLVKMHMAKNEWLRSHYSEAMKHFEEGWSLAKKLDEPKLLRSVAVFSTFFLYWQGRFQEVVQSYEQTVPEIQHSYPQEDFPLAASTTVGHCYVQIGQITQGLGMLNSIRKQCLENGDFYFAALAGVMIGAALLEIRDLDNALIHLKRSLEEASRTRNDWATILGMLTLASAYYKKGHGRKAVNTLRDILQKSVDVNVTVRPYPYFMELCWAMEQKNLPQLPGVSLKEEIARVLRTKNVFMKGMAYRYDAFLKKKEGLTHEQIILSFKNSLENLKLSGHQFEIARTLMETARQYLSVGEKELAKETALQGAKTLTRFHESFVPDDLRHLLKDQLAGYDPLNEILALSKELTAFRVHKDLLRHIVSSVSRITGAERGAIFLLQEDAGEGLQLAASKNLTLEQIDEPNFSSSLKLIDKVMAAGKGRIVANNPDPSEDPDQSEFIRSCICVPMILKGKVVGVLYHDNRLLNNVFQESDLDLLYHFASQAAFALDNAKAYEEIRRLNKRLKVEKHYYQEEHLKCIHFEEIIGESRAIKDVLAQIGQVAQTDTTVLIRGETGVGKELMARALHRHSSRRDMPFIRVHCSALPETLIPSELFGHEKGAFTGATKRKIGRFELADGGTLFLDEVGDLPMEMQVRLLRVLQTKKFERVGGTKTIESNFRLVTATNRDLEGNIRAKQFRADLYYRINVFPIVVPPLRERREDIPALARYFLGIHSKKVGKSFGTIQEREIQKLMQYDWPGNVRELENLIERGVILSAAPSFRCPELIERLGGLPYSRVGAVTLEENERRHILWALVKTGWKVRGKKGAAELLNIHPSTLNFRMKKLGIKRPN
ncbi:MAG: sigma 54-interacting transcriptional regulator [Deltaproteobacteria bacterium]|nr:sigma 54-interacting transcriptional regulator [Deltaproteobacteria bacterium]